MQTHANKAFRQKPFECQTLSGAPFFLYQRVPEIHLISHMSASMTVHPAPSSCSGLRVELPSRSPLLAPETASKSLTGGAEAIVRQEKPQPSGPAWGGCWVDMIYNNKNSNSSNIGNRKNSGHSHSHSHGHTHSPGSSPTSSRKGNSNCHCDSNNTHCLSGLASKSANFLCATKIVSQKVESL